MAYQNNGDYRHTELTTTVTLDGVATYKQFSLLPAFTDPATGTAYPSVTAEQVQRMAQGTFESRLGAFLSWLPAQVHPDFVYATAVTNAAWGTAGAPGAPAGLSCPISQT